MLPDAVKQADKDADEAAAAFEAELNGDTDGTSTLEELVEDTGQTDGSDDSSQSSTDLSQEVPGGDGFAGGEGESEEGSEGETTAAAIGEKDDGSTWKQRYDTLLGKYNAEVPRLTRDLDYLRGQVEAMARNNAQRTPAAEGDEGDHAQASEGWKRHLKKDELEEYDEGILDFQSRLAQGAAETVVSPVVQQLLQRIEYLEGRAVADEGDSIWAKVDKHFPGAKEINDTDPLFVGFLNQTEPISGLTYKDIGESAYNLGDVGRLVSLFETYTGKTADGGAATSSTPPTEGSGEGKATPPVKPSRSSGGTVRTTPKEKPVIRESDVNQFFTDVARGKYAGRESVMKKREALIESAVMEGRVRPG